MNVFLSDSITDKEILENKTKTLKTKLNEILENLGINELDRAITLETLRILARISESHPDIIVKCRELKNPAGASYINIGRSLVPSSIPQCTNTLVKSMNFVSDFGFGSILEYKVVEAIAVLVIYEIWKKTIFGGSGQEFDVTSEVTIPTATIAELKSAKSRTIILNKSFLKLLRNTKLIDSLSLSSTDIESLTLQCGEFCATTTIKLEQEITLKLKTQPLDPQTLTRFKSEHLSEIRNSIEDLPLFKKIKIGSVKPITFKLEYPREAFLSGTDTHYIFNGADSIAKNLHFKLACEILERSDMNITTSLPTYNGQLIIISRNGLLEILKQGFTTESNQLIWPTLAKQRLYVVDANNLSYYQQMNGEALLQASYAEGTDGLPISIEYFEENGFVIHRIKFYVAPYSSTHTNLNYE